MLLENIVQMQRGKPMTKVGGIVSARSAEKFCPAIPPNISLLGGIFNLKWLVKINRVEPESESAWEGYVAPHKVPLGAGENVHDLYLYFWY